MSPNIFAHWQSDAMLINCGRGGVCCGDTLCEVLLNKKVGSVALDVFCKEPTSLHTCLAWSVCFKRIACLSRRADKYYQRAGAEADFRVKEQKKFEEEQKDG